MKQFCYLIFLSSSFLFVAKKVRVQKVNETTLFSSDIYIVHLDHYCVLLLMIGTLYIQQSELC